MLYKEPNNRALQVYHFMGYFYPTPPLFRNTYDKLASIIFFIFSFWGHYDLSSALGCLFFFFFGVIMIYLVHEDVLRVDETTVYLVH